MKEEKMADEQTSYEFLKTNLYDQPQLYEESFRKVREHLDSLKDFESMAQLRDFARTQDKAVREGLKTNLMGLDQIHNELRPAIVEVLMFVLWDELVTRYGTDEEFSECYWDLIQELEHRRPARRFAMAGGGAENAEITHPSPLLIEGTELAIESNYEPDTPPPVPEENKDLWNYMGSKILRKAVEKNALTQQEAEVIMEYEVYNRSFNYIGKVLGLSQGEVFNLYEQAMPKLRRWGRKTILVFPDGAIICD